jgi:hypothetical protein
MKFRDKLGWVISRGLVVTLFMPVVQVSLFAPFLAVSTFNFLDPWSDWISSGGRSDAFPYGPVMLLIQALVPLLVGFYRFFIETPSTLALTSILLTSLLLLLDYFITARIVDRLKDRKRVANVFIFSPLILYVTYVLGQNDLIPAIALFMTCEQILKNRLMFDENCLRETCKSANFM